MGQIALLFSGQGAQVPGMGKDFYDEFPLFREFFTRAETIRPGITDLCFNGSSEDLALTTNTQPCMYIFEMAVAALAEANGLIPDCAAGFSLGEVSAISYAQGLSFTSGLNYIIERAKAMDEAASLHPGRMAAILKLDDRTVEEICNRYEEVWPVNYNSPGQVVISGKSSSVQQVMEECAGLGKRAVMLPVSGAFHSPYMLQASQRVAKYLSKIETGICKIPVYSNTLGAKLLQHRLKELMAEQISSPVLWTKQIETMIEDGVDVFVETGPGTVLTSLIRKINPCVRTFTIHNAESYRRTLKEEL
jgi:[acyl-carrier-protein] S-malonyltransferase